MKVLLTLFVLLFSSSVVAKDDLTGTSWTIKDSDEDTMILNFKKNNTCSFTPIKSYSGEEGYTSSECEWVQNKNLLSYNTNNNFYTVIAIISGNIFKGSFVTIYGEGYHGTLSGKRN